MNAVLKPGDRVRLTSANRLPGYQPGERGVGVRLLRAACDHAMRTGAVRLALSTAVTNITAESLYEREGWRRDTAFIHYEYDMPREGGGCRVPNTWP
jgi:ribosomal protein S18 acetylase RimI-like enzyme